MNTIKKLLAASMIAAVCVNSSAQDAPVAADVEVPLILLTELSSGGTGKGSKVAFMVTQDVHSSDGTLVIPRGAIAYGTVTWSRSAGMISKFLNEPARLAVAIESTVSADGKVVPLQFNKSDAKEALRFTGANTGIERASEELEKVLADAEAKKALANMLEGLLGKQMGSDDIVAILAARLQLSSLKQMAEARSLGDIIGVFKGIATGEITRIATAHTGLVVDAISELTGLRRSVGDRISGLFKGRNIRAYPGTPVKAYIRR